MKRPRLPVFLLLAMGPFAAFAGYEPQNWTNYVRIAAYGL